MRKFLFKSYKVYAKIFKRNMVEVKFLYDGEFPPKGFVLVESGFVGYDEFITKQELFTNYKEDYLGYTIYHFTYKRKVRTKDQETLEMERRAIEDLFIETE